MKWQMAWQKRLFIILRGLFKIYLCQISLTWKISCKYLRKKLCDKLYDIFFNIVTLKNYIFSFSNNKSLVFNYLYFRSSTIIIILNYSQLFHWYKFHWYCSHRKYLFIEFQGLKKVLKINFQTTVHTFEDKIR